MATKLRELICKLPKQAFTHIKTSVLGLLNYGGTHAKDIGEQDLEAIPRRAKNGEQRMFHNEYVLFNK